VVKKRSFQVEKRGKRDICETDEKSLNRKAQQNKK
jgi:hypothetical protein